MSTVPPAGPLPPEPSPALNAAVETVGTEARAPAAAPWPRPARAATPLLLAGGLGLAAYLLTNGTGAAGANLPVWLALLAGASVWAARRTGQTPNRESVTLLGLAVAFGLTFALWAAPPELALLNALGLLTSLTLGAAFLRFPGLGQAGAGTLLGTLVTGGLRALYAPFVLLERFPWTVLRPAAAQGRQLGRVGVGLALSAPLLLVFGALLASADAGFAGALERLWRPGEGLGEMVNAGGQWLFWSFLAAGLLYPALMALRPTLLPLPTRQSRLGLVEVGLPLGALGLLFVTFAALQVPALLGGGLPDGETYAAYIRRGFSELMTVAFLTLSVLLIAHGLSAPRIRTGWAYRALNAAVLVPLLIILASAAQRWGLYTQAYGLSSIRVLGAAFLLWVTVTLVWLALLLWHGRTERFAYPALLLGLATLLTTTALNPGALIARVNLHRQTAGVTNDLRSTPQRANVQDLLELGAGAVPTVVANLDALVPGCGPAKNCLTAQNVIDDLHDRYDAPRDLRAWNLAYARAHVLVRTLPPRSPYDRSASD
ncbi:DUF4173 domain-containing protein [Deinococcus sp. HMF7620]|uniref:DUF4173 domain-containing protein n=1 Tax=Deinococcus arboris TaxID=2682977 RepID=A0A7C9MTX3_9DEIO|nr:DUF4173 domain-containing protein [Deinococcus arboris]MVN89344.1 DUF4173 domain-containing protein [Deinococcus arboris]